MNTKIPPAAAPAVTDGDLADQAQPGHGIPSQDPDPSAQTAMSPEEAERESTSGLAAGGVMVGITAGAGLGTMVAGPVGAVVGGTVGAIAGAFGGAAAGNLVGPPDKSPSEVEPDVSVPTPPR